MLRLRVKHNKYKNKYKQGNGNSQQFKKLQNTCVKLQILIKRAQRMKRT